MIRPQRCSCMKGRTAWAKSTALRRFIANASSHSVCVVSRNCLAGGPPALVTQTSMRPNAACVFRTKRPIAVLSRASTDSV